MPALHLVSDDPGTLTATDLVDLWCLNCGMKRLPWMKPAFSQLLAEGFAADLLHEAISRTARAPRPSWAYFQAIINNCRSVGVYDLPGMITRTSRRQREAYSDLPY